MYFFSFIFHAGALSPLHTRRGPLNDLVTPTPDFAEFNYLQECPKLLAVTSDEDCQNVAVAFSDLVFLNFIKLIDTAVAISMNLT